MSQWNFKEISSSDFIAEYKSKRCHILVSHSPILTMTKHYKMATLSGLGGHREKTYIVMLVSLTYKKETFDKRIMDFRLKKKRIKINIHILVVVTFTWSPWGTSLNHMVYGCQASSLARVACPSARGSKKPSPILGHWLELSPARMAIDINK